MRFGTMRPSQALLALLPLISSIGISASRLYTVKNHCPTAVRLYINGQSRGHIKREATVTKSFSSKWSGFIYTDANGGSVKGSKTTRAGFYGETDYYYIVKDAKKFNVGISVAPKENATKGFCPKDTCSDASCEGAFSYPPTRFPGPDDTAPTSPLFACPGTNVGYTVTFCPSGAFPAPRTAVSLHPNGDTHKCLDVRGANYTNGAPVQIYDCNGTPAQKWILKHGKTTIQVAGTPYCLDAGTHPKNGDAMSIWYCDKSNALPAQTWNWDGNNTISLANSSYCLDLTGGVTTNSNKVQTWGCYANATNQRWTT